MSCLRASWLVALALLAGCIDERSEPHAGPPCTGPHCALPGATSGAQGGSGPGSGPSSSGAGGGTSDVTGTVRLMADTAFSQTQAAAYEGEATVIAEPEGAPAVSSPYGAGAITFTLLDVPFGDAWLTVRDDTSGGTGVLSTIVAADIPPTDPLVLPVVDLATLQSVADGFPGQPTLAAGSGHIVVTLQRDGDPLPDVELDPGSFYGGVVAYDEGVAGDWSSDALATGAAGKILLINAAAPVGGKLVLNVIDADGTTFPLEVRVFGDAIAIVGYELP